MTVTLPNSRRSRVNRRAFLRGAAGVALGLPFLESLPERSAWAAGKGPIFSLFICAVDGVVPAKFFPKDLGQLTADGLAAAGKATSQLSAHAENLLFVRNISWPTVAISEPHAQSLCMALTAVPSTGGGQNATSGGPSADWVIARKVQGDLPPLTLYAGNNRSGYIDERLSFSEAGTVTKASNNPYELYQKLIGVVSPSGTPTPGATQAQQLLFESRKSIHDLVRDDLRTLMANPRMSSADRQRLQQHFDAIRDAEVTMGNIGDEIVKGCAWGGLEISKLEAMQTFKYKNDLQIEDVARLQMSLVAFAFACNYNRTATLQWGSGTDRTVYPVPANQELGNWNLNFICHRNQSDGSSGSNPVAAEAHAEIDVVRMQTLAAGLDHFKARGLQDQSFVLWTNAIADCPSDSFRNVPIIIWGNGGGYLKQAAYVDSGGSKNSPLLNSLISAAIQDTGETMDNFGEGPTGQLSVILA